MLDGLNNGLPQWPQTVKEAQMGWIGKSEGARIKFKVATGDVEEAEEKHIEVFTTRPETIFGVTYIAISPDNTQLLDALCSNSMAARNQLHSYKEKIGRAPTKAIDLDEMDPGQLLHGVQVLHPFTGAKLPVYVASYVLADYGPGALMGVPMHDERDCAFALENNLTLIQVLHESEDQTTLVNSTAEFDGLSLDQASKAIVNKLAQVQSGH